MWHSSFIIVEMLQIYNYSRGSDQKKVLHTSRLCLSVFICSKNLSCDILKKIFPVSDDQFKVPVIHSEHLLVTVPCLSALMEAQDGQPLVSCSRGQARLSFQTAFSQ